VYDLGCGDGRIPIAAARLYGARGVGIDIDPRRIEESKANARAAGVENLVEFRLGDVLEADVSPATVVTLYLLGSSNARLRPILTKQLKPGARIISHAFSMGPTWPADRIDRFTTVRGDEITLYLWKADGRIRP
jgi:ribosomal protein L11 methylase PrmA